MNFFQQNTTTSIIYNKEKTCCFTGHREFSQTDKDIKERTKLLIIKALQTGYSHFISGGAIGFDMLAAELLIKLKKKHKITIEIAIPCKNQDKYWGLKDKKRYCNILKKADIKTFISENYTNFCMQKRNEYMADNSSLAIAYFNGKSGGTKNTISYCKRTEIKIWYV